MLQKGNKKRTCCPFAKALGRLCVCFLFKRFICFCLGIRNNGIILFHPLSYITDGADEEEDFVTSPRRWVKPFFLQQLYRQEHATHIDCYCQRDPWDCFVCCVRFLVSQLWQKTSKARSFYSSDVWPPICCGLRLGLLPATFIAEVEVYLYAV